MKVTIDFPPEDWWELCNVAETQGVPVAEFVTRALQNAAHPAELSKFERERARRQAIVSLVRQGLTDDVIAERLGELRGYVAEARRRAGLAPNTRNHLSRAAGAHERKTA